MVEKHAVTIPETIRGFVKCANPKCVTNNEPVETSFLVIRNGTKSRPLPILRKDHAPGANRDRKIERIDFLCERGKCSAFFFFDPVLKRISVF